MPRYELVARSHLDATPEAVSDRISTMAGVNDELAPLLRHKRLRHYFGGHKGR